MFCRQCGRRMDGDPAPVCGICLKDGADPAGGGAGAPSEARPVPEGRQVASRVRIDYDPLLESKIVNGFLTDPFLLAKAVAEGFDREMLVTREARCVFDAIRAIQGEGGPHASTVDPIIIRNHLRQLGLFDQRMDDYLKAVGAETTPELAQVLAYMQILNIQLSKVKLYKLTRDVQEYLLGASSDASLRIVDFMAKMTKEVRDIQRRHARRNIGLVKSQMIEIAQDLAARERLGELDCLGYALNPFADLSAALSGLRKGFLYGIGGAPRTGKTTFALELATIVAATAKVPVLFFTWEQTQKNLTYRILAKETRINPDTLQRNYVMRDREKSARFTEGWRHMETYMDHLYIIEGSRDDTPEHIKAYAYNAMQDAQTDEVLIVCDYLQKMPLEKGSGHATEKVRVEELTIELKYLALELNCPVLLISSLSKEGCLIEVAENDLERPGLYHFKGSGEIEYDLDAACVMTKAWGDTAELRQQLAHRAEAAGKDAIRLPKIDVMDLHLDKNRDAPEGKLSCIQYLFFVEENRFFEIGYKIPTNAFRFNRIETHLARLIQEGLVKFREIPRKRGEAPPPPA